MPKVVDHDAMRSRLLDAAGELFAARGYAATGMRELAAAAGVSTGSLYHYFPDKRALFEQLVERTVEADLAELEEALGPLPRSAPVRRADSLAQPSQSAAGRSKNTSSGMADGPVPTTMARASGKCR